MPQRKILLVDDEAALLQLLEKHLIRLGFLVEPHARGLSALASFQASPASYDLMIADLGLPDMPGDTLLHSVLQVRADLPVLICSGTPYPLAVPKELRERVGFLQKPFLPKMLAEAIGKLLGEG